MAGPTTSGTTATTGAPTPAVVFPAFNTETYASQLVWLAITFGALYYVMSKIALPKVGALLDDRRARIKADLDEAARLKAESDRSVAAYETSLTAAKADAQAVAGRARDEVTRASEARRKALEDDLAVRLEAAERSIRGRKEDAMSNVQAIAAEAASAIVERLTGQAPAPGRVEAALAGAAAPAARGA